MRTHTMAGVISSFVICFSIYRAGTELYEIRPKMHIYLIRKGHPNLLKLQMLMKCQLYVCYFHQQDVRT